MVDTFANGSSDEHCPANNQNAMRNNIPEALWCGLHVDSQVLEIESSSIVCKATGAEDKSYWPEDAHTGTRREADIL